MKQIKLVLRHLDQTKDSTISELTHESGEHIAYILEDGERENKVWGETRIPRGTYEIVPRKEGGFYDRYRLDLGFAFVPHIIGVNGFTWILIHAGNKVSQTAGCLLTGTTYGMSGGNYVTYDSRKALVKVYDLLKLYFDGGHRVFIEIAREQKEIGPEQLDEPDLVEPDGSEITPPVGDTDPGYSEPPPPVPPGTDSLGCAFGAIVLAIFTSFATGFGTLYMYLFLRSFGYYVS